MTLQQICRQVRARLAAAAVPDPDTDAALIACHVLGIERGQLLFRYGDELAPPQQAAIFALCEKRASRVPLQRLLGQTWFMGLPFFVEDHVLVPRADTEILCEQALQTASARGYETCLDLCTGSGILAVCLAKLGGLAVTAADISPHCIAAARKNAAANEAAVDVVQSDAFAAFPGKVWQMIVCNPPYIPESDRPTLMPEVADHDPALALFAGDNGLAFYKLLAKQAPAHIAPGGALLVEVGVGQADAVAALFAPKTSRIFCDLAGIPRCVAIDF